VAFPQTPLPVIVSIAPGADPADDPDNWDALGLWTDITDDVRVDDGINITAGRSDEANHVDASKCTFRLDNRSGDYSPRNPMGIYYGALRKNTPVRVQVELGQDSFNRTASNSWGTADSGTSWGLTGSQYAVSPATGATITWPGANSQIINYLQQAGSWDSEVLVEVSVPSVPVGAVIRLGASLRYLSTNNGCWAVFAEWQTDGTVDLRIGRHAPGSFAPVSTLDSAVTGYTANQKIWVRGRAIGNNIQGKLWYDGSAEPLAWQVTFAEPNTSLRYDTSSDLLGPGAGIFTQRFVGNTSPTSGNIWSFSALTSVFTGNVVEWPVRWDQSGNDSTVPVEASGVIRRLSQGQSPLQSPLYKTLSNSSPYAYWPLEDESGATSAQGVGTRVQPASVYSASFGYDGVQLSGSKSSMTIEQDTTIAGQLPVPSGFTAANGWEVDFFFLTEALPPLGQPATIMSIFTNGSEVQWNLVISNDGTFGWRNINPDGTVGALQTDFVGAIAANVWYSLRCEVYNDGADIKVVLTYSNLSTGESNFRFWLLVGETAGYPKRWAIYGSSTSYPHGSVAHVAFFARHNVFAVDPFVAAAQGYAGETASDRMARLCAEQGVAFALLDDSTTIMGPQQSDTFLNLLREAETADMGVLYETAYAPGFGYRPRTARYTTASRATFTVTSGHIAEPPEPTDDDQNIRNDWTVSRVNGGTVQVTDDAHIAEYGRYDDSVTLNVSGDDVLVDHAALRVFLGTLDELRWPSITLDLARNPTLMPTWLSMLVGSRFAVVDPPSQQLTGVTVDLLVEGFEQQLGPYSWTVTLNCSPAKAWSQFGTAADTSVVSTDTRIDSDVSFLHASITSSATSMVVERPADTQYWDTTAVPFDLNVFGEQMTVTAISGTGTTQTFTVTRSVNGVVKAHTASESVSLWQPSFAAL
jgi:hypothetical protein